MGEVPDGDAQMGVPEVDADDDAGVPAERDAAGPASPAEVGVTSTVPPSFSSRTMLETVAADRPVVLAISAWVREPARRTARTTRSRLARCSDDCDPGVSIDSHPHPWPASPWGDEALYKL